MFPKHELARVFFGATILRDSGDNSSATYALSNWKVVHFESSPGCMSGDCRPSKKPIDQILIESDDSFTLLADGMLVLLLRFGDPGDGFGPFASMDVYDLFQHFNDSMIDSMKPTYSIEGF